MLKSIVSTFAVLFWVATQAQPLDKRAIPSNSDIQTILNVHNTFRARHSSPPLVWNATLANFANQWTLRCQFAHSGGPYGENLALRTANWNATVSAWYNEVSLYDYNNPGFSSSTGHFTQVVWKDTTQVGCAVTSCPNLNGNFYACEYSPRGNVIWGGTDPNRFFRTNVLPPRT